MTARTRGALLADPALLRTFRDMATLREPPVARPADAPLDREGAAAAAQARGMGRLAERLRGGR
jgi:hypothetical protein